MDTNRLKSFSVVARTENVRRASEILRLSPSALSKSIKQLELDLGVSLITPLGRGITLTREGKKLAVQAEEILRSIEALKYQIRQTSEEAKHAPLRIATFEVFSTYFLQVLEDLDLNSRKLILYEAIPGELEQAIEQNKADLGISYLPIPSPHLEHIKITKTVMGVYRKKGVFENRQQEDLPFVVPVYPIGNVPTRVKGLDGWPEDAYTRKVHYEVTLMESALELCRQGKCAGYFPSFIIERHNRKYRDAFSLVRHPRSKTAARCYTDVFIVKRKDRMEDRDLRLVSKMIRMGTKLAAE